MFFRNSNIIPSGLYSFYLFAACETAGKKMQLRIWKYLLMFQKLSEQISVYSFFPDGLETKSERWHSLPALANST